MGVFLVIPFFAALLFLIYDSSGSSSSTSKENKARDEIGRSVFNGMRQIDQATDDWKRWFENQRKR